MAPARRVVAVDLDGTLLPHDAVSEFLAARLGHTAELAPLEARYRAGLASNAPIAEAQARALDGLALARVEALLAEIPVIGGIARFVAGAKRRGAWLLIATVTWSFAARYFARRFGFDDYCGTVLAERDGHFVGRVARHFDAEDKRAFVAAHCAARGLDLSACVAIGDSRSDIPLFGVAGLAVALNATPEAKAAADVVLAGDDLAAVLALMR